MIRLGLTGSIGMGKSTVAQMFKDEKVPVYSADAQVHKLYQNQAVIELIDAAFPGVVKQGKVERSLLSYYIRENFQNLEKLEAIIHPLLRVYEQEFLQKNKEQGHKLVVLDIPLLYERKGGTQVDYVVVVTAPFFIQYQRVMARENMEEEKFNLILSRQLPDEEKRRRADFIINTNCQMSETREIVQSLCHFFISKF